MAQEKDFTTAICMFHHPDHAEAAVKDLVALGLSRDVIAVVGGTGAELAGSTPSATLLSMRVPEADVPMLLDGLRDGGTIVAVRASEGYAIRIDEIFKDHSAAMVDEKVIATNVDAPVLNEVGTDGFYNPHTANFDSVERNRLDMDEPEEVL